MRNDSDGLFGELEPPAGGLERFRQRLENTADTSDRSLRPILGAGVAVAALVIAAFVALREPDLAEPEVAADPVPQVVEEPEPQMVTEPEPLVAAEQVPATEAEPDPLVETEPEERVVSEPEPQLVAEPAPPVELEPRVAPEPSVAEVFDVPEFDRLLGRQREPRETRVSIDDMPVGLTEVPGTRPGIRIYEVRTN